MRDNNMRNKNPIARVKTAKNVMSATECTNEFKPRINMSMIVKIKLDDTTLQEIARTCGCAPCQILALNNVTKETDLEVGQIISVPVATKHMVVI